MYKCALKRSFEPCPPKQDFLFRTLKRARNKHFLVSNPFELENFRSLFLLYSKAQKLQKPVGKLSFVVRIGRRRRQPNTAWTGQNPGSSRALDQRPGAGTGGRQQRKNPTNRREAKNSGACLTHGLDASGRCSNYTCRSCPAQPCLGVIAPASFRNHHPQ